MENLKTIKELLGKTQKKITNTYAQTWHGGHLLEMAELYHIPYNKLDIDWLKLINDVNQYLHLVKLANDYGIAWDYDYYDPICLSEAIEDEEIALAQQARKDYHYNYQQKLA